ncbi:MAG TPA: RseA family anti-sigma factor [Arenimonas sp.]|nr:RseA family anti-sigma factor [Arenimonas sp.]
MKPINENDLEQLSAYIDGELSDSERRFFQKRLANDEALRACCERAWIASSVLKSQPFQLMPADSAERICAQCDAPSSRFRQPLRLVASFGALALVAALGYQLLQPSDTAEPTLAQAPQDRPTAVAAVPEPRVAQTGKPAAVAATGSRSVTGFDAAQPPDARIADGNDPSQFELNESTRAKSWPKSGQNMEDYVVRHNEMIGANANSGLVSYAQILAEPETESDPSAPTGQDKELDTQ